LNMRTRAPACLRVRWLSHAHTSVSVTRTQDKERRDLACLPHS